MDDTRKIRLRGRLRRELNENLLALVSVINTASDPDAGETALYNLLARISNVVSVAHDEKTFNDFISNALYLLGNL